MADNEYEEHVPPEGDESAVGETYDKFEAPSEEVANLVVKWRKSEKGRERLKKLEKKVRQWYTDSRESSEDYRKRLADDWAIFMGKLPPKSGVFQNTANIHVPLALENIHRLSTRMSDEILGDFRRIGTFVPIGPGDAEDAANLTLHTNFQLAHELKDFKRQMARGILLFIQNGDVVCHSYFDPITKRNRHEILDTEEFVAPWTYSSVEPDLCDLPYYFRVRRYFAHELRKMSEVWDGVEEVIAHKPSHDDDDSDDDHLRKAVDDLSGMEKPDGTSHQYKVAQFEGWLRIPVESTDAALAPGKGKKKKEEDHWCQGFFDVRTWKALSITVYEEAPWEELERFERQEMELAGYQRELEQYAQAQAEYPMLQEQFMAAQQEHQTMTGILQSGPPMIDPASGQPQPPAMPPPPEPPPEPQPPEVPTWIGNRMGTGEQLEGMQPDPMQKQPIRMFTHGVCLEAIDGFGGVGLGRIQAALNRSANVLVSQTVDAATLNNNKTLLATERIKFKDGEELKFAPGRIHRVEGMTGAKLSDHLIPLEYGPANPQMLELVMQIRDWAQASIQAPDVLSGAPGKSGETYRGLETRVEQALKPLTVLARRFGDFVTHIIYNNCYLNGVFLPDEKLQTVTDHAGTPKSIKVTSRMYQRRHSFALASDMSFVPAEQKVRTIQELLGLVMSNPFTQTNSALMYELMKQLFMLRDLWEMIPLMGSPPPPPVQFGMPVMPPMPGAAPGPGGGIDGPPAQNPPPALPGEQ